MTRRCAVARLRGCAVALLLLSACRSTLPGQPVSPLAASSGEAALVELRLRRDAAHELRSLVRVRSTSGEKAESFRAQISVAGSKMDLSVYTPLGTTALTVHADGDRVRFHDLVHRTEWEGSAADLARKFGFFASDLTPAEMTLLIMGYPAGDGVTYETTPTGLASARTGDVEIAYDPPVHPPKNVVVTRAEQRIEITYLDMTAR